jgi:hypothetical protein
MCIRITPISGHELGVQRWRTHQWMIGRWRVKASSTKLSIFALKIAPNHNVEGVLLCHMTYLDLYQHIYNYCKYCNLNK